MILKMNNKPDIFSVAKAAGVSPSTVSRAFNHPDLVKPNTRKKIDRVVRRLGYIRNRAAQTIHGIRSGTIGLIVPTIDHAIFAEVVQAFSEAVAENGFTILLATHGYDLQQEYSVLRKLLEHRVDGVALIGTEHRQETYELLEQQGIPAIIIWNYDESAPLPCVGANNIEAGKLIAQHLVDSGHRKIALIFPPLSGNDRAADRYAGVKQVLEASGIEVSPHWSVESPYSVSAAKSAILPVLDNPDRPTAVLCGNDILAWGVINCARSLDLDVPSSLSVLGIGHFKAFQDMEPSLTTVRLPAHRIGSMAGTTMSQAITQPEEAVTHTFCPSELVIGKTLMPLED